MTKAIQSPAVGNLLKQRQSNIAQISLSHRRSNLIAYSSLRAQSTSSSSPPPPSEQIPPHRRQTGPPSNHKLFYRDIVPPLFRVLAYGSAVFFSLQLAWQYLDGREQKKLEEQVRIEMEEQVRKKLESRGVVKSEAKGKSWWSWLGGK